MSEPYLVKYAPAKYSKSDQITRWKIIINDHEFSALYTLKQAQQTVRAYIEKCEGER